MGMAMSRKASADKKGGRQVGAVIDSTSTSTSARRSRPALAAAHNQARRATMNDNDATPAEGGDHNVDQIRDILFGGQMRQYERRFQELAERLERESVGLRGDMEKRLGALERRLDEQIEKLGKSLRQEASDRNQAVDDLEARNLQALRLTKSEFGASLEKANKELSELADRERHELGELGAALREAVARVESTLTAAREELRSEKVGREDLAALFSEAALRLKGEFELPTPKKRATT
jgi:hypothetical protein